MKQDILWIDDEVELLKPYTIFLAGKGYEVATCSNGPDAIQLVNEHNYDIIFLDENMPGMSGIEVLSSILRIRPDAVVVMITKNEEENLMDLAIGHRIADYLIKPVNPNQILMTLKKHLHKKEIVSAQTIERFQSEFRQLSTEISEHLTIDEWYDLHRRLTRWDLQLSEQDTGLHEMLHSLMDEADNAFRKYVTTNYEDWIKNSDNRPMLSMDIFRKKIFPMLDNGDKVLFLVIDNFRYDQWCVLQSLLSDTFETLSDNLYLSILPSATQYARNAIFSGLTPLQISQMFPDLWVEEGDEESKNSHEVELLRTQLNRFRRHDTFFTYSKIMSANSLDKAYAEMKRCTAPLSVLVINFVDMLSHASTDNSMIRELAADEAAFRSITLDWFRHSGIIDLMENMGRLGYTIVITTDHGMTHIDKPVKVLGDRNTSVSLRYKVGKSLNMDKKDLKEVYEIKRPNEVGLPSPNISSSYLIATGHSFFAYPNNYNYYVSYYKDTFQHGGISMNEMIIPLSEIKLK
ncbi:MAG: PglZ domain-containing protein [Paludibacteraceae bacterium]|nr:PglZ domain-containing protein [Paludibacteraceae bacterium]